MSEVFVLQRFDRKRGHWRFLTSVATAAEAKAFLGRPHKDKPRNYRSQRFVSVEEFIHAECAEWSTNQQKGPAIDAKVRSEES